MSESIGQQLRQARQRRSLSLEQVAQVTHLRVHYLQALEFGELAAIPSMVQARGFLRIYASYLELDAVALLGMLEGSTPSTESTEIVAEPAPEPATPPAEAAAAFADIGQKLLGQREVLGLSLDDVERHTHLRTFYLQALEAGDLDRLPSPVQGRGMLSNYAEFLGMDPEPLLLRFADGLQARLAHRRVSSSGQALQTAETLQPRQVRPPSRLRRFFSTEALIGGTLVGVLVGFALWAAIRVSTLRSQQQPAPTAPSIAEVLLAASSPSPSPSPVPPTATVPLAVLAPLQPTEGVAQGTLSPLSAGPSVQVYITVRQRAWVRVIVDEEIAFEGRVIPGGAYQYSGAEKVEILTGNGAGIQVFYNSNDLGPMGLFGEVVNRVYTLEGILAPTPTITLTPTETEQPTSTPRSTPPPPAVP